MEKSIEVTQIIAKIELHMIQQSHSYMISKGNEVSVSHISALHVCCSLFTITKKWKQPSIH
jgi:hypothetical protein